MQVPLPSHSGFSPNASDFTVRNIWKNSSSWKDWGIKRFEKRPCVCQPRGRDCRLPKCSPACALVCWLSVTAPPLGEVIQEQPCQRLALTPGGHDRAFQAASLGLEGWAQLSYPEPAKRCTCQPGPHQALGGRNYFSCIRGKQTREDTGLAHARTTDSAGHRPAPKFFHARAPVLSAKPPPHLTFFC